MIGKKIKNHKTRVAQICPNTEAIIEIYESCMEAERATGAHASHIGKVLNGKRALAGGYFWMKVTKNYEKR